MQIESFNGQAINKGSGISSSQGVFSKQRWVAHVSVNTKLAASHRLVLNIKPNELASAFDIIERLLFAKTCAEIFCDHTLTLHQVEMLKQMAMFSGTEVTFIADKVEFNSMQSADLEKA